MNESNFLPMSEAMPRSDRVPSHRELLSQAVEKGASFGEGGGRRGGRRGGRLRGSDGRRLLSAEHFSVDGTLIEAWASMKSFRRQDAGDEDGSSGAGGRNRDADFRGQKRRNDTHASTSDGDARLYRKGHGQESRL